MRTGNAGVSRLLASKAEFFLNATLLFCRSKLSNPYNVNIRGIRVAGFDGGMCRGVGEQGVG